MTGFRLPTPDSRLPSLNSRLPSPDSRSVYLGIDGGQTQTKAVIADGTGRIMGRGLGGPSNHVEAPGGRDRLRRAVIDSAGEALRAAGLGDLATMTFAAVYCGMTGEADFKTEVITPLFPRAIVRVEHDAPAALAGATLGAPGIVVIAGTGSVVFGENAEGTVARTGGWGYVFGDEGSGFGLARDGVRAALDALDDVGPPTRLVERLTRRFAMQDLRLMPMAMYNGQISRDGVAEAAADVLDAWRDGDHVAAQVVTSGLEALARRVRTVATRVHLAEPLVCLSGGVFRSAPYAVAFTAAVQRLLPTARVQPARLSPAAGAVLLAFRTAGIAVTDGMRDALVATALEDRS